MINLEQIILDDSSSIAVERVICNNPVCYGCRLPDIVWPDYEYYSSISQRNLILHSIW